MTYLRHFTGLTSLCIMKQASRCRRSLVQLLVNNNSTDTLLWAATG